MSATWAANLAKYKGIWRGKRGSPRSARVLDVEFGGDLVVIYDLRVRVRYNSEGLRSVPTEEFDKWIESSGAIHE